MGLAAQPLTGPAMRTHAVRANPMEVDALPAGIRGRWHGGDVCEDHSMSIDDNPWSSAALEAEDTHLVQLPVEVIEALSGGSLHAAREVSEAVGAPYLLTPYLLSPECLNAWRVSSHHLAAAPGDARWLPRLIVDFSTQRTVGWAGFQGLPDSFGRVDIGYAVDPLHRRKGYARAALVILLEKAEGLPEVRAIRTSLGVDDTICRHLVALHGFVDVGAHRADEAGLVTIFERTIPHLPPALSPQEEHDDTTMGSAEQAMQTCVEREQTEKPGHRATSSSFRRRLATFVRNLSGR